jgi:S-DNA-T family DNA segregation ATPase FtsK/SpoIIIE
MPARENTTPQALTKKQQRQSRVVRRRQIGALLLVVTGVFFLLSILSYCRPDESILDRLTFFDAFRLLYNADVKTQVSLLQNHLGFFGASVANFFVVLTIGFFSLIVPLLMICWGAIDLLRKPPGRLTTITNYALLLGCLFATTFGVSNAVIGDLGKEWSGVMGAYTADIMVKLFGAVGASLIVMTMVGLTAVFAIDLDVHRTVARFESLWHALVRRLNRRDEVEISRPEREEERPDVRIQSFDDEPEPAEIVAERLPERGVPVDTVDREDETEAPVREKIIPVQGRQVEKAPSPATDGGDPDEEIDYVFPSVELLDAPRQADAIPEDELKANAELVRAKLANFGVEIESVSVTPGPVITLYELVPASGVKISRIVSLADDLALALAAKGIRIIAPIPGKSAVGVEIPNRNPSMVYLRSVLNSGKFRESKANLPIALGKTIAGEVFTDDLTKMPHLLIAGSTGSGKSVGINTILASLLFRLHPSDVKFVIIDPKKIELTNYGKMKNHFLAISPDSGDEIITTPEGAVNALRGAELEMEKRYDRLAAAGVRNIQDYNERLIAGRLKNTETITHRKMPYLLVVIDELADLMMTAAREVEEPIARLAQLARAVGIHLVVATQRPSVDVITGVIKANFPARIAYQVASKTDSRTILDMNGAEQLLGSGDMLYLPSGSPKPTRIQNAFISTEEVERLTDYIAGQRGYSHPFMLPSSQEKKRSGMRGDAMDRDEYFEDAARLIVRHQQGSVSLLQRRLKVGYSRAARLVDELEAAGVVGPFDGSKAREVLIQSESDLEIILKSL